MKAIVIFLVFFVLCTSVGAQSQDYLLRSPNLTLNPPRIMNSLNNGDVDAYDTITVTSPNGGENWLVGSNHNITWSHQGTNNVNIYLTTNAGTNWMTIFGNTANDGTQAWVIPDYPSTRCLIWIRDVTDTRTTGGDKSNSNFTIYRAGFNKNLFASFIPADYSISNSPNPFRGSTTINYSINKTCKISIKVYDLTGKEVATIKDGFVTAGKHSVIWKTGVKAGVYVCKLTTNNQTLIHKITVLN